MKKWINISFDVGQMVYLKTDVDQSKRIVTAILMRQNGLTYQLTFGTIESWHFDFEISETADIIIKTSDK